MEQTHTLDDLNKLTLIEFHKYWFIDALTDKQMAEKFGTNKKEVKRRRKELGLTYLNGAMLRVAGGTKYQQKPTPKSEYMAKKKQNSDKDKT